MNESVKLTGLVASTFGKNGEKSVARDAAGSTFGKLLDDRVGHKPPRGEAKGTSREQPAWSWVRTTNQDRPGLPAVFARDPEAGDALDQKSDLPIDAGRWTSHGDGPGHPAIRTEDEADAVHLTDDLKLEEPGDDATEPPGEEDSGSETHLDDSTRNDGSWEEGDEEQGNADAIAVRDALVDNVKPPDANEFRILPVTPPADDTATGARAATVSAAATVNAVADVAKSGLKPMVATVERGLMAAPPLEAQARPETRRTSALAERIPIDRSEPLARAHGVGAREPASPFIEGRQREAPRLDGFARPDRNNRDNDDPLLNRVTLLANQKTPSSPPAPGLAQLGLANPVTQQVVAAIRDDAELPNRISLTVGQAVEAAAARSRPMHSIQIQLHPADLGRVTARMTMEGSQLRVELQVETSRARAQLASDSNSILKSLKASGYEIERVTVQQVQQTGGTGNTTSSTERGGGQSLQGGSSDESGDERPRREAGGSGGQRDGGNNESMRPETARGGVFI
jgi:chemotaxis protein MotD